jgi:hypothetical protein
VNRSWLPEAPIIGNEQAEAELVATPDGRTPPGPRGNLFLGSIPEIRLSLLPARPAEVEAAVALRPRAPCWCGSTGSGD